MKDEYARHIYEGNLKRWLLFTDHMNIVSCNVTVTH